MGAKMPKFDVQLNEAWWALRVGLGGGLIVAGTDKFFNLLTDWSMYLSAFATKIVPVKGATFMHAVGIIEILLGALLLTRWTRIASLAVIFWLAAIVANLTITGMFYDLAMRDTELAIGGFALFQLTVVREKNMATRVQNEDSHPVVAG
jgi:uncharacterized membrane protein YphA (DoxX/SURF4 family)